MSHIYDIKLSKYCDIDTRLEHLKKNVMSYAHLIGVGDMRIPSDFQLVYMIPRKSIKWLNIICTLSNFSYNAYLNYFSCHINLKYRVLTIRCFTNHLRGLP